MSFPNFKNKHKEAEVSYQKIKYLYPNSPLIPNTLYSRGMLLYKKLKQPQQAIDVFNHVTTDYPESEFAGFSLFYLGELEEKKIKNYS